MDCSSPRKARAQTFWFCLRKPPSQKPAEHGSECAFKKPGQAPLATTKVWSRSHNFIPAQYQTAAQLKRRVSVCTLAHTCTRTHWKVGAQLNRVRERGSGGQVCKPHTPSRVTKVTKGMCTRLSPIPLSTLAVLSLQTGGKHTITQEALHNLFVSLRKGNTVKHYHSSILLCRTKIKLIKPGGVVTQGSTKPWSLMRSDVLAPIMLITVLIFCI